MRTKRKMRSRQGLLLIGLLALGAFSLYSLHKPPPLEPPPIPAVPEVVVPEEPSVPEASPIPREKPKWDDPPAPERPAIPDGGIKNPAEHYTIHPISQLVKDAEDSFKTQQDKQSRTLKEAVTEYKRRYGMPPPPNFDKWYKFAKGKGVKMIDEYDSIHETLTPFWGLKPKTIRSRAKEAMGFNNNLIGMLIRKGEVVKVDGGSEWQQESTKGMMKGFIKHLPDMDLCFNVHDEPRVVVPFDDLSRLVGTAKRVNMPAANAVAKPRNSWSKPPSDMGHDYIKEVKLTRFNVFAHQPTWTHSRASCPPDSPARVLEDGVKEDNFGSYSVTELGFIQNHTAFTDVCQSPSFSETFGFFDRPNAFNIVHDLFPIFSQSKISSYNDILYPSPWYWSERVPYDASVDRAWDNKEDKMYWRGSTTGGFSRDGGWRRQHRQNAVHKVNAREQTVVLENRGDETKEDWQAKEVPRSEFRDIFDVYFSSVGQCDPGDCDAQKEYFDVKEIANYQDAWNYKYLLDIDGNAFSGRFYAFLKSKSMVFKMAVFREWHEEWLKPWVHYIPLSLRGNEWVEAVRWFAVETAGKKEAERIALQSRQWAGKALRNEDLEVWFFRLLLEYGRVIDDDRELIGYA